jgi:hypothetical protein
MNPRSISRPPASSKRAALALPLVLTGVFLALGFCSHARTNPHLAWIFAGGSGNGWSHGITDPRASLGRFVQ